MLSLADFCVLLNINLQKNVKEISHSQRLCNQSQTANHAEIYTT